LHRTKEIQERFFRTNTSAKIDLSHFEVRNMPRIERFFNPFWFWRRYCQDNTFAYGFQIYEIIHRLTRKIMGSNRIKYNSREIELRQRSGYTWHERQVTRYVMGILEREPRRGG